MTPPRSRRFASTALKKRVAGNGANDDIRLRVAGRATEQEAFSIASMVCEIVDSRVHGGGPELRYQHRREDDFRRPAQPLPQADGGRFAQRLEARS